MPSSLECPLLLSVYQFVWYLAETHSQIQKFGISVGVHIQDFSTPPSIRYLQTACSRILCFLLCEAAKQRHIHVLLCFSHHAALAACCLLFIKLASLFVCSFLHYWRATLLLHMEIFNITPACVPVVSLLFSSICYHEAQAKSNNWLHSCW